VPRAYAKTAITLPPQALWGLIEFITLFAILFQFYNDTVQRRLTACCLLTGVELLINDGLLCRHTVNDVRNTKSTGPPTI
jgi:hypothetical protein